MTGVVVSLCSVQEFGYGLKCNNLIDKQTIYNDISVFLVLISVPTFQPSDRLSLEPHPRESLAESPQAFGDLGALSECARPVYLACARATASALAGNRSCPVASCTARHTASATSVSRVTAAGWAKAAKTRSAKGA